MALLSEVFKRSGLPTVTFVRPAEFERVLVSLQTPGKGIIVEGPSGIGKSSCIRRALEDQGMDNSCIFLSARKPDDVEFINLLPTQKNVGVVVIDDFHKLNHETKVILTDYLKVLADEEDASSKLILIGINRAGQSLLDAAPDLLHRIDTIRLGRNSTEKLEEMINSGERALNCSISVSQEIITEAEGSFAIAQILCFEACLEAKVTETQKTKTNVGASLPGIREAVLRDLASRFFPVARDFATGNKLRREGRAPYLHLLRWLAETVDGVLDTKEALARHPDLKGSVTQVIDKGHLGTLLSSNAEIALLLHFNSLSEILSVEDPKFLYFCRNLIWSVFARQVGYYGVAFRGKYDFALSFAGEDRAIAEALSRSLEEREIAVFYDKNEQHRILANDVEEYLAPIYRSESRFVVALLSGHYPKKIWTKFESDQFKERFGAESVIPIWFSDCPVGLFDDSRRVGGIKFDTILPVEQQISEISDLLAKKLAEERQKESVDLKVDFPLSN